MNTEESSPCHDFGAGRESRGYGSASLAECLKKWPDKSTLPSLLVKEEPESPGLREGETTQRGQTSELPPERSADPGTAAYYQKTSSGLREAPWVYVMNELRSVQFACEQLRSRMDSVEISLRVSDDTTTNSNPSFFRDDAVHEFTNMVHCDTLFDTTDSSRESLLIFTKVFNFSDSIP